MASWEDEDFDVPVAAASNLNFDEEDDGSLGDWEAGLDSDDEGAKKAAAKPKISSAQRIAERKRKEQEERERKASEKTQDASKSEQRQKEIESDLNNASDSLSSVDVHPRAKSNKSEPAPAPAGPTKLSDSQIFKPTNAREYADLRKTLSGVINDLADKNSAVQHCNFIIELCRDLCKPLKSDQVNRVDSTSAAVANEKYREERAKRSGARAKPNSKMAANKSEKPAVDVKAPETLEDDGLDDDDFM